MTIEDTAELRLQQPHVVRLEARPAGVEGRGEVTIRRLVRNALRMRPDRIVVGEVASFRAAALDRIGLTPRETEVLGAAAAMQDEADIAWELFLSLRAVRERLARVEARLGVRTAVEAVARALPESA